VRGGAGWCGAGVRPPASSTRGIGRNVIWWHPRVTSPASIGGARSRLAADDGAERVPAVAMGACVRNNCTMSSEKGGQACSARGHRASQTRGHRSSQTRGHQTSKTRGKQQWLALGVFDKSSPVLGHCTKKLEYALDVELVILVVVVRKRINIHHLCDVSAIRSHFEPDKQASSQYSRSGGLPTIAQMVHSLWCKTCQPSRAIAQMVQSLWCKTCQPSRGYRTDGLLAWW
jgi:hypothetical protein